MNSDNCLWKFVGSILLIALFVSAFFFFGKPKEGRVYVLDNPTLSLGGVDGDKAFRITSDNSRISLSAVSLGAFVLNVDGNKYISSLNENNSYSIPQIDGKIQEVVLSIAEEKVSIELISEEEIEITKSRFWQIIYWALGLFLLLCICLASLSVV